MAKCSACGREFRGKPQAEYNNSELWDKQLLCPACRPSNSGSNHLFANSGLFENRGQFTTEEAASFKAMRKSLQELEKQQGTILQPLESNQENYHQRNYPRHQVQFDLKFSFLRDKRIFKGEVTDLSQTGLCFVTNIEVCIGQTLLTIISTNQKLALINRKENLLEVRRVIKTSDGKYMVGGRFIRGISVERENRRKHHRRTLSVPLFYRHPSSDFILKGMAMDISKSGLRMNCMGTFKIDEEYLVMLRTFPPTFMESDLRGTVRVMRVLPRPRGRCEVGCSFLRLKVTPLSERGEEV